MGDSYGHAHGHHHHRIALAADRRRICIAEALTAVASIVTGVVTDRTTVSDDLFRYPFTSGGFVVFTLCGAVLHLMILIGILGLHALREPWRAMVGQHGSAGRSQPRTRCCSSPSCSACW